MPIDAAPTAIRTRTIEANGLTFTIDEAGDGPDIALCLHGFPESRFSWRHQLEPLAAMGWHAVAPDLRGYGDSSRPAEREAYRLKHLITDATALFDALGARRRLIVAHDWGAVIAWAFALVKARPLDGLVIMNVPHPDVFRAVLKRSWAQRRRSWYIVFFQLPWLPERVLTRDDAAWVARVFAGMAVDKTAFPPAVLRHYQDNALRPGAMTAMLNYYRANISGIAGGGPPRMIDVPTLMIWGEHDVGLGIELTEGHEAHVVDFTLKRFPNVSHWVQQEAPGPVNETMATWLASRGLDLTRG